MEKKYKLLFHNGSFKEKSIKVWYSKAQDLGFKVLQDRLTGSVKVSFRVHVPGKSTWSLQTTEGSCIVILRA